MYIGCTVSHILFPGKLFRMPDFNELVHRAMNSEFKWEYCKGNPSCLAGDATRAGIDMSRAHFPPIKTKKAYSAIETALRKNIVVSFAHRTILIVRKKYITAVRNNLIILERLCKTLQHTFSSIYFFRMAGLLLSILNYQINRTFLLYKTDCEIL